MAATAPGTSNAPQEAEPIADGAEPAAGEAAEQGFGELAAGCICGSVLLAGWAEFCNSMDTELQASQLYTQPGCHPF